MELPPISSHEEFEESLPTSEETWPRSPSIAYIGRVARLERRAVIAHHEHAIALATHCARQILALFDRASFRSETDAFYNAKARGNSGRF